MDLQITNLLSVQRLAEHVLLVRPVDVVVPVQSAQAGTDYHALPAGKVCIINIINKLINNNKVNKPVRERLVCILPTANYSYFLCPQCE